MLALDRQGHQLLAEVGSLSESFLVALVELADWDVVQESLEELEQLRLILHAVGEVGDLCLEVQVAFLADHRADLEQTIAALYEIYLLEVGEAASVLWWQDLYWLL